MGMILAFKTVFLLIISNIFMTFAWYGHLKFKHKSILFVIFVSWLIAFFEYCFHVPANRYGHGYFTASQLKVLQEVITFGVFAVFSILYLKERPTLYDQAAFVLIVIAVFISMMQPRA